MRLSIKTEKALECGLWGDKDTIRILVRQFLVSKSRHVLNASKSVLFSLLSPFKYLTTCHVYSHVINTISLKKLSIQLSAGVYICLCSGCVSLNELQPHSVEYYKQSEKLLELAQFQEVSIKAPTRTITAPDGTVTVEPLQDGSGNWILPTVFVKDTGAKPPKTAFDVAIAGSRALLGGVLGWRALDALEGISLSKNRDPLIISQPAETRVFAPQGPSQTLREVVP